MMPSEYFKKPVIGTVTTKEWTVVFRNQENGEKITHTFPPATYDVIEKTDSCYIANSWHKEYKHIPQLVPMSHVDKFEEKK